MKECVKLDKTKINHEFIEIENGMSVLTGPMTCQSCESDAFFR